MDDIGDYLRKQVDDQGETHFNDKLTRGKEKDGRNKEDCGEKEAAERRQRDKAEVTGTASVFVLKLISLSLSLPFCLFFLFISFLFFPFPHTNLMCNPHKARRRLDEALARKRDKARAQKKEEERAKERESAIHEVLYKV